jgi:hypothetical protein
MRRNTPVLIALLVFVLGLCFSATLAVGQSAQTRLFPRETVSYMTA